MRKVTTDHAEILRWAGIRGATPAQIDPLKFDGEPAILTFLFGDVAESTTDVATISWDQFFALFDLLGLSLAYDGGEYELLQIESRAVHRFEGKQM